MDTQQPWKSLPHYIYTCMNTLCGILNSLAQNITYTTCGSVTHKMPNVICSYACQIKFWLSAFNSGIKGLHKENNFMHKT